MIPCFGTFLFSFAVVVGSIAGICVKSWFWWVLRCMVYIVWMIYEFDTPLFLEVGSCSGAD